MTSDAASTERKLGDCWRAAKAGIALLPVGDVDHVAYGATESVELSDNDAWPGRDWSRTVASSGGWWRAPLEVVGEDPMAAGCVRRVGALPRVGQQKERGVFLR